MSKKVTIHWVLGELRSEYEGCTDPGLRVDALKAMAGLLVKGGAKTVDVPEAPEGFGDEKKPEAQ